MGARTKILNALVDKIKGINGSSKYNSNLHKNVENRLKFWDEINDFPYVCLTAGDEVREYLPGNFKWGFLTISIRIYVKSDNSLTDLENVIDDIEYVADTNYRLTYDTNKTTEDIRIVSITTDEGLLHPTGIGEVTLQIRYSLT